MLEGFGTRGCRRRVGAVVSALAVGACIVVVQPTPMPAVGSPDGNITSFSDSTLAPELITAGPDGNLWFSNYGNNSIGRITPTGVVTSFTDPSIFSPTGIAAGPDGNLWFVNSDFNGDSVGRITPAGVLTNFPDPSIHNARSIAAGPDGNLWFTNHGSDSIGRITTAGVVTSFTDRTIVTPTDITAGPDGNLWYTTGFSGGSVGRITPAGVVTEFRNPTMDEPTGITSGPDGNLWFTNLNGRSIGRITTAGVVTNFTDPTIHSPWEIITGPDGNLWFTDVFDNSLGRITPTGVVTEFTDASVNQPFGITTGPDGNLWFTNTGFSTIGRLVLAEAVGIGNAAALEGDAGSRALAFTVSLSKVAPTDVTVDYRTLFDTADPFDFAMKSGTVTIPAGTTSAKITVRLKGDANKEPDEKFKVKLSNAAGATITRPTATATILNDDVSSGPRIGIGASSVLEGTSATRSLRFTVTLSAPATKNVKAAYTTVAETATAADDFVARTGTVKIKAGETAATISIEVAGDAEREPNESFSVVLSGARGGAKIAQASGTGTILDDD